MPASYRSPKTRIGRSPIHGQGLFATRRLRKGEIVAIKGGHILDRRTLSKVWRRIADSYIQIDDSFYIDATRRAEIGRNKIYVNHSCEPNLGFRGPETVPGIFFGVSPGQDLEAAGDEDAVAAPTRRR